MYLIIINPLAVAKFDNKDKQFLSVNLVNNTVWPGSYRVLPFAFAAQWFAGKRVDGDGAKRISYFHPLGTF